MLNFILENDIIYLAKKDLLTKYGNQTVTYDAQGNPTSYLGHTLTWEKGRQLKSFDGNTYTYNANGIRTSKTVNGVKHTYTLDGTKILREAWDNNTLIPLHDNGESVCGIVYKDTPYYFVKNLQGDIIAIVDKDANTVAKYSYDAWGVCTIIQDTSGCSIATVNPFRYRSYYYDEETSLYYVFSRYYDPEICHWINSDDVVAVFLSFETTYGVGLYSYCNNDPVNNIDNTGYWLVNISTTIVGILLDAFVFIILPYIFTAFKATRLLKWAKASKWFRNKFNSAIKGLAKSLYNAMDSIMYKIMGKAANAATRAFTISKIQNLLEGILNFSIGYGIALIIDILDRDGRSGYIRF